MISWNEPNELKLMLPIWECKTYNYAMLLDIFITIQKLIPYFLLVATVKMDQNIFSESM